MMAAMKNALLLFAADIVTNECSSMRARVGRYVN